VMISMFACGLGGKPVLGAISSSFQPRSLISGVLIATFGGFSQAALAIGAVYILGLVMALLAAGDERQIVASVRMSSRRSRTAVVIIQNCGRRGPRGCSRTARPWRMVCPRHPTRMFAVANPGVRIGRNEYRGNAMAGRNQPAVQLQTLVLRIWTSRIKHAVPCTWSDRRIRPRIRTRQPNIQRTPPCSSWRFGLMHRRPRWQ
jgi:hypothetical protein